jgi:HPt (histidine-containing phosphotransfer) domain-containing protein
MMVSQDRTTPVLKPSSSTPLSAPNHSVPAIDLVFLTHQTLGDEQLEIELLLLFDRQARDILTALGSDEGTISKSDLAHRLKGSARAIGARAVAEAAARYEAAAQKKAALSPLFAELARAVSEARATIHDLMPMAVA